MIKARQMKHAMQNEDLDLVGGGMLQRNRIPRGDFGGNRYVARQRQPLPFFP